LLLPPPQLPNTVALIAAIAAAIAITNLFDTTIKCRVKVLQLKTGCPLRRLFEVKLQNYSSAKL
jgi:hypothetical protein